MFFGGIPQEVSPSSGAIAATNAFIGCLGDATVNGAVINFANSTMRPGAVLGKCAASKDAGPKQPLPPPSGKY